MTALTTYIRENNDGSMLARMSPIMMSFGEELADEMAELDELTIRAYMFQIGEVISWIGHGDNDRLPEAVRGFGEMIQPSREYANTPDDTQASDTPHGEQPTPLEQPSGVSEL